MRAPKVFALVLAAVACLLGKPAGAEPILWRTVKSAFSEFRIFADPVIARDPKLAFILDSELADAEQSVREWDAYAREQLQAPEQERLGPKGTEQDLQTTFHLLAATDRHVTVMQAHGECNGYSPCFSGESIALFQFPERTKFERAEALQLDGQIELLNHLAKRDEDRMIGRGAATCPAPDADVDNAIDAPCRQLSEILGFENNEENDPPFKTARNVDDFAKRVVGVGFSTGSDGHVTTLDIYIDYAYRRQSYRSALKWSLDAKLAAPLLQPALRDLVNDSNPAAK